ncbi:AAA family ATPase [Segniliparus rugosus]|uniref:Endonuclease GajA/Old nuclease/RecF-like AAA domain-containing protein n=1 Tax=Segniliparus rugosus (strain ATCC BAA-974 / DSM 45345 / CCUG 50838 / CIP 108380 / JCM 13579 / CDC 945) TaxID=679197 RepID=E5XLH4_SEGRC|nr:AAA family ATPase [Segniliparus rugosus]EFV14820.1 hypothetical protein HMPREF9336_00343 [Segniliparus rugosus ATCC BAA-974]
MRLHRIKLEHYRGVRDREVVFAADGVTVVEGPNESGKSSMIEALDLLFEAKDASKTRQVRAIAPKGADAAPSVEAELESGPYRFVYAKQWLKRPSTTLTVLAPKREQLTGEAAHERAHAMLASTVDLSLWKALRMLQTARGQVEVDGCPALLKALDAASGPVTLTGTETTLLARIEEEVRRYYTPGGRATKELRAAQENHASAEAGQVRAEAALEAVRAAAERHDELAAQVARAEAEREESGAALRAAREHWDRVGGLADKLELAKQRAGYAAARSLEAQKSKEERERLAASAQFQTKLLADLSLSRREAQLKLIAAQGASRRAAAACQSLRDRQQREELGRAEDRLEQAEEAAECLEQAQAALASAIEERTAQDVFDAARQVELAEARVETASARMRIMALSSGPIEIDGALHQLEPGASLERIIVQPTDLTAPGFFTATLSPGSAGEKVADQLAQARSALARALERAEADTVEAVRGRLAERARALGEAQESRALLAGALGSQSLDRLRSETALLRERVAAASQRDDQALEEFEESEAQDLPQAEEELARAQRETAEAQRAVSELDFRSANAETVLAAAVDQLAQSRERESDEQLAQRARELAAADLEAQGLLAQLQAQVSDEDVESVRAAFEEAHQRERSATARVAALREDLAQVNGQLLASAQGGYQEAFDTASSRLVHAKEALERVAGRARAAQLLWETVTARRDAAQSRYAAPLERAINELGGSVFGDSFAVQLDGQLRVDTRTLLGTTVDFDSLSEGAKEQIGMLVRLACAKLVDPLEGAPVVIDDALGHSDPQRLAKMRDTLAATAGQVIVLTCFPERFSGVGTVVRL